ncbi:MAG: hypothetical protein WB711_17690 [Terriglobales bacterium]
MVLKQSHKTANKIGAAALRIAVVLTIAVTSAWAIEPYSMKPAALQPSADLPQNVADSLDADGTLVFTYDNGIETPICEIYWAKTVIGQESPAKSTKVLYGNLKEGALVGVVRFLAESKEDYREDFHDQKLSPGYYTMRYTVMREGDKTDFVLLSPAKLDRDPDRIIPPDELARLSRQASGTEQPAVLSLVAVDKKDKDFPDVIMADDGSCILQVKLHFKATTKAPAGELAFAVIVATAPDEVGGS